MDVTSLKKPNPVGHTISSFVREIMQMNNLSNTSLGKLAGVSHMQISRIINGALDDPSPVQAHKLCNSFGWDLDTIRPLLVNKDDSFFFTLNKRLSATTDNTAIVDRFLDLYFERYPMGDAVGDRYIDGSANEGKLPGHCAEINYAMEYTDDITGQPVKDNMKYVFYYLPYRQMFKKDDDFAGIEDFTNKFMYLLTHDSFKKTAVKFVFFTMSTVVYNHIVNMFKDSSLTDKNCSIELLYLSPYESEFTGPFKLVEQESLVEFNSRNDSEIEEVI